MPGATVGLLTPAARLALMNLDTPPSYASAWLRVADATITGSGVSSLPDLINTNPAVQATDALRPPLGTSANGLPILSFTGAQHLALPTHASNANTQRRGVALWIKQAVSGAYNPLFGRVNPDAGTNVYDFVLSINGNAFNVDIFKPSWGRNAAAPATLDTNWHFVTFEYDGTAAGGEANICVLTIDGVPQTCAFVQTNGAASGMPTTLTTPFGNCIVGSHTSTGPRFNGSIGPNIFWFSAKMAGATLGLLTPAARAELMAFEAPT